MCVCDCVFLKNRIMINQDKVDYGLFFLLSLPLISINLYVRNRKYEMAWQEFCIWVLLNYKCTNY